MLGAIPKNAAKQENLIKSGGWVSSIFRAALKCENTWLRSMPSATPVFRNGQSGIGWQQRPLEGFVFGRLTPFNFYLQIGRPIFLLLAAHEKWGIPSVWEASLRRRFTSAKFIDWRSFKEAGVPRWRGSTWSMSNGNNLLEDVIFSITRLLAGFNFNRFPQAVFQHIWKDELVPNYSISISSFTQESSERQVEKDFVIAHKICRCQSCGNVRFGSRSFFEFQGQKAQAKHQRAVHAL